jgi:hypothetical protein
MRLFFKRDVGADEFEGYPALVAFRRWLISKKLPSGLGVVSFMTAPCSGCV